MPDNKEEKFVPELVVGIVARMGVDVKKVIMELKSEASKYNYNVVHIKVSNFIGSVDHGCVIKEEPIEERYHSYISCCNKIRELCEDNRVLALLTANTIKIKRKKIQSDDYRGIIYVVDQLKRPEEVETLRDIYGNSFIALSCHSTFDARVQFLTDKITADHSAAESQKVWKAKAIELIGMDESEKNKYGQAVRSTFPLADYILDSQDHTSITEGLNRLFRILFNDPSISPNFHEYCNNLAAQAAYRSIDLSRQVGAAILDYDRKIIALGANEVPKFGGGTYWPSDKDDRRDQMLGFDVNTIRKRSLVIDVVKLLQDNGKLTKEFSGLSSEDLSDTLLSSDGILKKSKILDTLEYGRALHAEMNAITDAARSNSTTQDAILFVTTFPCHNCAKHIVGAGIKEVYYLEPYSKSAVAELYPDSIEIDSIDDNSLKVSFRQFCGVTKRRFHYFAKDKLKDDAGKVLPWSEDEAKCIIKKEPTDYIRSEVYYCSQLLDLIDITPDSI